MKNICNVILFDLIICSFGLTQDLPTPSSNGEAVMTQGENYFVLYEQMANPGTNSLTSQNFETLYDSFDTQGADDFIISGQGYFWTISSVEVLGPYYNGTGPAASVNVWFYYDSIGHPGAIAASKMNIVPSGGLLTGSFLIPLTPYVNLSEGTYWLSVQCNMDFAAGGQWGWTEQLPSNLESNWQNPLGGFLTPCSSWGYRVNDCNVGTPPYYDLSFRLNGVALPVELESFTASASEGTVELTWITATETNNNGFEVQRSNGGEFEILDFVEGHGTTTEFQVYSYSDRDLNVGSYSYKLKQIDFDGTFDYSNVVEVDIPAPAVFALEQNYPNPFNPSTSIQYAVSSRQFISLKVYDILGNEIETLVNEEKPAGTYEVEFNASSLPGYVSAKGGYASGVYFYQMLVSALQSKDGKAGSFIETKKMILLK